MDDNWTEDEDLGRPNAMSSRDQVIDSARTLQAGPSVLAPSSSQLASEDKKLNSRHEEPGAAIEGQNLVLIVDDALPQESSLQTTSEPRSQHITEPVQNDSARSQTLDSLITVDSVISLWRKAATVLPDLDELDLDPSSSTSLGQDSNHIPSIEVEEAQEAEHEDMTESHGLLLEHNSRSETSQDPSHHTDTLSRDNISTSPADNSLQNRTTAEGRNGGYLPVSSRPSEDVFDATDDDTVADPYDEKPYNASRVIYDKSGYWLSLAGLLVTVLCGLTFLGFARWLTTNQHVADLNDIEYKQGGEDHGVLYINFSPKYRAAIDLGMNIVVTICTETVGSIHSTTLRWALAKEGKLDFNANLRIFRANGKWYSPLGPVANGLYGICLILSYVNASMIFVPITVRDPYFGNWQAASFIPPTILGFSFIIQAVLALAAFTLIRVPTWSSNCLDVAAAAYDKGYIKRYPDRCLRSIEDKSSLKDRTPVHPKVKQISMWSAHRSVRHIVWLVWSLLFLVLAWAIAIIIATNSFHAKHSNTAIGHIDWNIIPHVGAKTQTGPDQESSYALMWGWAFNPVKGIVPVNFEGTLPTRSFLVFIVLIAFVQGCLTIGLNCCGLIVVLARDESMWRRCGTQKGSKLTSNPLKNAIANWQSMSLLVLKPFIHWLFGNSIGLIAGYGLYMLPVQLFYLFIGTVVLAIWATYIALLPSKGSQPATYGHLQTLINLVDDWERSKDNKLYWGHIFLSMEDGIAHAGTSHEPLQEVRLNELYAGCTRQCM